MFSLKGVVEGRKCQFSFTAFVAWEPHFPVVFILLYNVTWLVQQRLSNVQLNSFTIMPALIRVKIINIIFVTFYLVDGL